MSVKLIASQLFDKTSTSWINEVVIIRHSVKWLLISVLLHCDLKFKFGLIFKDQGEGKEKF